MKISKLSIEILLLLVVLLFTNCKDDNSLLPPYDDQYVETVPPPSTMTIDKPGIASFQLIQTIQPSLDLTTNEVKNSLLITNVGEENIESITIKLDIFDSVKLTDADRTLTYHKTFNFTSPIQMNEVSDTIVWNTSWTGKLNEEFIDLTIIEVDNKPNHSFQGIYEGHFSYEIGMDSVIIPGFANGHIDFRGNVHYFFENASPFAQFVGEILPTGEVYGTAIKADGSTLDAAVSNQDSLFYFDDDLLKFSLFVKGGSVPDSLEQIDFRLIKQ